MGGRGALSSKSGRAGSSIKKNWKSKYTDTEVKLLEGVPASERKDYYYRSGDVNNEVKEGLKKAAENGRPEALNSLINTGIIEINESMPKISDGSEKQISWAESIRQKAITNQIETVERMTNSASDAKRKQFMENVSKITGKNISTFSGAVNEYLKSDKVKNNAFIYFKNAKSAKEIINDRFKFGV